VSDDCPKCPAAKELVRDLTGANIEYYDVKDLDGRTEAVFYDVFCTPSLLVTDDAGVEMHAWRCDVPSRKDLRTLLI
jgi:hypothetical protein